MLCVSGRAEACLDQFDDSKQEPQKFSALKEQLKAIFDSPSDRGAKMADFEQRIRNIDESEEEFMTSLIQTFRTANPSAANEEINRAVKRKFLQGIPVNLRRYLFIFCNNPYDTTVSPQDLKASRDAIIHLSASTSGPFHETSPPKVLATSPTTSPPDSSAPLADPTLAAIMLLSSKFDAQAQITQKKLEAQQDEINALRSQFSVPVSSPSQQHQQFQPRGRQQRPRYTQNSRRPFQYPAIQFQSDGFHMSQSSDVNIRCHFCHGLNYGAPMQTIFGLKIYVPVFIYMGGFSNISAQIGACHTYFLCALQNSVYASLLYAVQIFYMLFKILYAVQNFYMLFRYFICCSKFYMPFRIFICCSDILHAVHN